MCISRKYARVGDTPVAVEQGFPAASFLGSMGMALMKKEFFIFVKGGRERLGMKLSS